MKFNTLISCLVLFTAHFSMAMDNRKNGSEKGDFKVELRARTAAEMAASEDKTQKYILIVGEDEKLDKDYLVQLKSCVVDAIESASNKAKVRKKILELFDSKSNVASVLDSLQSGACSTFNSEREKRETGRTIFLTTPNFEGLNTFIAEHLFNCLDSSLNKSYRPKTKGNSEADIAIGYTVATIKKYCPKEGS